MADGTGRLAAGTVVQDMGMAEQAAFLNSILESSTEYSIVAKDLDGLILAWNEGARRIYGYEAADVVGKANAAVLHSPDDVRSGLARTILEAARQTGKWEGELRRVRKDRSEFTAHVTITLRRDATGRAVGFTMISRDLTESQRIDRELRESQEYNRGLIESNIDALMTTDPIGVISDVNRQMCEMTGYARELLISTPFNRYFTDPQRADEGIRRVLSEDRVTNYELTMRARNGKETVVSYNATTFRGADGKLKGVFAAARDITEQKRLEEDLRQAQNYTRGLIEASVDALMTVDPDLRITDVNEQTVRLTGYAREELIGSALRRVVAPDDLPAFDALLARGLQEAATGEIAFLCPDGSRVLVQLSFSGLEVQGARGVLCIVASDLTERKRAEEEILESEARFRSAFEEAAIGMALQTLAGQYLRVNDAFCRMVGYTEAELLTMSWRTLTHPADIETELERRLLEGEVRGYEVEKRYLHRDGHVVWASVNTAIVHDRNGRPLYFIVQIQDISARKQAEATLRASEERYRLLAEHVTDVIWVFDRNLQLTYVSPSVTRLRGYTVPEVLGQTLDERLTPASLAAAMAVLREELEIEQRPDRDPVRTRTLELELPCKDGSTVWCEMRISILRDPEGHLTGFIGVSRDITQRRRAEGILRLQAAALDAAANAIVITDREGVIRWVNPAFTTMTGYRAEEVFGQTSRVLKSGKQGREFYQGLWATILTGQTWQGEMINRRRDGSLYTESQTITPVRDASGVITHFIAIKQDVTERKLLEDELRQAQKMEAIGRLAGGVAHDFNNLLTIIQGRSALLLARLPPDSPLRRQVEFIDHAGLRAAALTRQLLAFSRRQVVEPKVLDVPALVAGFEPMLRRLIGEDIELVIASVPPVGRVKVDPGQLEQVIMNLVVNARDAMPRGGRLRVETTNVELDPHYAMLHSGAAPGLYVMLAVSDTGVGMDAATQARIFEPFFTTKGEYGTGLGLATVYGIVKQAGGTVQVYSEPGHGAIFKVFLPRVAEMPELTSAIADTPPPGGTETILLVEDEEALRHLTREVLAPWGYTVLEARHGPEALLVAAQYPDPIHLLLTDVIMPQFSGRELADRLATTRPGLRVLYMSGYTAGAIEQHGVLDAGIAFIQKPFTPTQLARKVREVLDRGAHRGLRILLAEDSLVNQTLITRLLGNQGHAVIVAGNGRDALTALERESFDLVLMDVQMPEMDGLEATAAVRRYEAEIASGERKPPTGSSFAGGRRIPILAVTALAMKGDQERCLAAGMDGYLAKPIRPGDLAEAMHRLLGGEPAREPPGSRPPVDLSHAFAQVDGDTALLIELVERFREDLPARVEGLRTAIRAGDARQIERAAHGLRGSLATLGADTAHGLAAELEAQGRETTLERAATVGRRLERELERVTAFFAEAGWAERV